MVSTPIQTPALIDTDKITGKKIIAFGAHPDDIEFTSAGTIFQLSRNNDVHFAIATDGSYGTHDHNQDRGELVKTRYQEARESAKQLKAKEIDFWSYPDLDLQNRKRQLLKKVVKALLKIKPDIVFSWDPWGKYEPAVHPDHRALAWAVAEGVMMSTLPKWIHRKGLGNKFLSPKPQLWLYAPGEANIAVDISPAWEQKITAIKLFKSQFDSEVVMEKVESRLQNNHSRVGEQVGVQYAEPFRIMEYRGEWDR